jgi:bifunctional non-homologous end joining protein LigD
VTETRRVGRRTISLSNPDKVLWPEDGVTKSDLVDYYEGIADVMLPFTRDRLMTLERFPDGISAGRFYSKDAPRYFPNWIDRETVPKKGGSVSHVVCNDRATLVYLANQACITLHVGLSRIDRINNPDQMIFDLDPSTEDFSVVRRTAVSVRDLLDDLGLTSFVRVSGSRGLHVVTPLDRSAPFEVVREFARDFATLIAQLDPDQLTIEHRKTKRGDRLFVDWMRNAYGQTAVASYSVRARPGAPVAVPLAWEEVEDARLRPDGFTLADARARLEGGVEPWRGWRRRARSVERPRARLERLLRER